MPWFVYIIRCTDNALYTGITTDLQRRFNAHKNKKGAKYFYAHTPSEIVYTETAKDRSNATKRELSIKKLSHSKKILLINSKLNTTD
jgi:putative endonuclease